MRQAAINAVYDLAKLDARVIFIGSDLGIGTLEKMKQEMPERFFMEGVSEQHMIGMAAGLAMDGFIPYLNTIATFITRRCYEQIAIDLCAHDLPVRLMGSGGGLVYAPLGPTHLAVEDIAIMRALPKMAVVAPVDAPEMRRLMEASIDWPHPMYIRFAKGGDPVVSREDLPFTIGRAIVMIEPDDVAFMTTGVMTSRALDASGQLKADGIGAGVIHAHTVKPLDQETILEWARKVRLVVTVEEHTRIGGLGSAVLEMLAEHGVSVPVVRLGLPDAFSADYGSQDSILAKHGLQPDGLAQTVRERLGARVALK
jgi:transketolase